MNEFELINLLTSSLPSNASVVVGAGDDCAVIDVGLPDRWLLFKTDAVAAGVHFTDAARPEQIGHKAVGRCMSDIAAMAGAPLSALITIALPSQFEPQWIAAVYNGMRPLAQRYDLAISGGETTANPGGLLISVAMIGFADKKKCVLRSGAKPGDAIFVTGQLGGSMAGKHLDFEPRLSEAQWLADKFSIHAMLDVSDGLASDLRHLLNASKTGAELLAGAIPISKTARQCATNALAAKPPLGAALTDGEDFELLFTVASLEAVPLLDAWKKQFPNLQLSCIGKITAEPGLTLRHRDQVHELTDHGYIHFT